jgi:hypothetical protein
MARIVKETTIKAPPNAVFAYVSDITRHPEWGGHQNTATARNPGPVQVGSVYDTTNHQFGTQHEPVTVTDYAPNTSFGYESTGKIGLVRHGFDLKPAGDSTQVTKWMDIVRPSLMTRLLGPMITKSAPPAIEQDLQRIKAKLES